MERFDEEPTTADRQPVVDSAPSEQRWESAGERTGDLGSNRIDAATVRRAMASTVAPRAVPASGRVQRAARPSEASSSDASAAESGLPEQLRSGIEQLSGFSMNDVDVRYNSARPAQLGALAFASRGQIHIGPGQEEHLPHEAWHLVQQSQGRVRATAQLKSGQPVNESDHLEREADVMGAKALAIGTRSQRSSPGATAIRRSAVVQREDDRATALQKVKKENMDAIRKIRDRVKNYRKRNDANVNAGTNSGRHRDFTTPGGTNNPLKLNRGESKWKFKVTDVADDLDGSDSATFKKRYEHAGWSNILIHVE